MSVEPDGNGRIAPRARGGRPPSKRGAVREQEIIDAAVRIFHDKGYAATSIQDIADAVGLLKGSLYYYVPSKEDLLYRIVTEVHSGAADNLRRADELDGDEVAKLRALIRGHLLNFGANLPMVRVFYIDFTHLSAERHREILEKRRVYERFLIDLIAAGQRKGLIAADIDAHLAGIAILTMINSIYMWYRPEGPKTMEQIADEYEKLVLRSLGVEPELAAVPPKRNSSGRTGKVKAKS